jgi:TfoX/Sxy family transcriptional regulator of competence genes
LKQKKSGNPSESKADPEFESVVAVFADLRDVKRGRMFSSENVLSVNGKIFAMLTKGKFVVKLPKERADELVSRKVAVNWGPGTRRVMKEWVTVESKTFWVKIAEEAYQFVRQGKRD